MERQRRHTCSDCSLNFTTSAKRDDHAFDYGHMRNLACLECRAVFNNPKFLKYHMALHKDPSSENTITAPSAEFQRHFASQHWLVSNDVGTALRGRPHHGYAWASPALSESVHNLLLSELLDSNRREIMGFPTTTKPTTTKPTPTRATNAAKRDDEYLPLPPRRTDNRNLGSGGSQRCAAIVIDCEMVELADHAQDLVRVSAVDFLTGEIVLDSLVQPTGRVKDWRSRVSGVDPALLRAARTDPHRTVLAGWQEARARIFSVADAETILIGHALANDLKVLRIAVSSTTAAPNFTLVQQPIIDSLVLVAQAAFGRQSTDGRNHFPRTWGLSVACKELLSVAIQLPRRAHEPLEDALATRELVIWCLTHPDEILEWGVVARKDFEVKEAARREKQRKEAAERAERMRLEALARLEALGINGEGEEFVEAVVVL